LVIAPRHIQAGVATPVLVEALDASNHRVPNYNGTVQLSSSDSATLAGATLPTTYQFQSSDRGSHVFNVTFAVNGSDSFTVADTSNASVSGTVTLNVGTTSRFPWFTSGLFKGFGDGFLENGGDDHGHDRD
jgi:hypothetical protein